MPEDPFTAAELEAGATAVVAEWAVHDGSAYARLVLGAAAPLIAARVREQVAEEIAQVADAYALRLHGTAAAVLREGAHHAAAIVRAHRTTPPRSPLMADLISRADANEAVVELLGGRIAAVLADCDRVQRDSTADEGTHDPDCWLAHTGCWAARIRRHLTGEDHPNA